MEFATNGVFVKNNGMIISSGKRFNNTFVMPLMKSGDAKVAMKTSDQAGGLELWHQGSKRPKIILLVMLTNSKQERTGNCRKER